MCGYGSVALLTEIVVHGMGMSLKYRIEARGGALPGWERGLFWLRRVASGGPGARIALQFATPAAVASGTP